MGDLLVNILGIASNNQNRGAARPAAEAPERSRSWSKSRGHKAHGRKHAKKD